MDSERWERIQKLFHAAADQPASARRAFLNDACEGDEQLIAEVMAMLEQDACSSSLLEHDVGELAARVLDDGPSHAYLEEFKPYRLLQPIGEGGMGVVYLAERDDLGNRVAIKLLRDAWMSPVRRQRFAAEQRLLAQLTHPLIARLYDADTLSDGTPWFAMEYVKGVPLTTYCREHNLPVDARLNLFRSVCQAVQYAHSHAIIHRDLKPSNILVQEDGSVKLLDFGIAKQLDVDAPREETHTGLRLMTPAYAAPEQLRGEPAGIYTDIYSLGVVLYELLSGQLPFETSRRTPTEFEALIVNGEPDKPSIIARRGNGLAVAKNQWADLDVLCLTAMHKEPERRYASVEALLRDIDHYIKAEPLEARPDSVPYRLGKFVRRNRRAVAAAALVFLVVAALVAFYTYRLTAARNVAVAEAARTERVLRFTLNLFNGGDKEAGPAKDLRVTTLLNRGVVEARTLDRDPEVQAQLYQTLGEVYQKLGDFDRADSLLHAALNGRRARFRKDHVKVAESIDKLALLRMDQAKFDEAAQLARQALDISRRSVPADHSRLAAALYTFGRVLEERGSYDDAIRMLEQSVRLRTSSEGDRAGLADSILELANSHFYAGHYEESEKLNQRLLLMHREMYGDHHPLIAEDLINLGAIQQELGHYAEAEKYHRQALAINEPFYGQDHYKTASNLVLIARAVEFENRFDEARQLLGRALTIQEKFFGPVHPRVASVLNDLGNVALHQDRDQEAERYFRRIVDIYRSVYDGKHYLIGVALANLASVFMDEKDYSRAEPIFREALAMFGQTLPPDHLNIAIARIKLGRTLLRQHRFQDAQEQTLAGYRILSKQASPAVSWLISARKDLAAEYEANHETGKAREILAEQAAVKADLPARK